MTQTPVTFIYAAERSGTTVFRLMLHSHPGIKNPIEADFLFDHIERQPDQGWAYDTDGLGINWIFEDSELAIPDPVPDGAALLEDFLAQFDAREPGTLTLNLHRNIARAATLRPDARIIHLLRDPRDVARSSIGMGWAGIALYGADKWCVAEDDWNTHGGKFASDRVLTVRYEDLITQTEAELRRVCAFLEVPFDPVMLRYYEGTTYDAPDPKLIYQWRRKMAQGDLALVEGRLGDLLTSRGYAPSGVEPVQAGALQGLWLWLKNKWEVWRMASARFGFLTVLLEKIGRRFGLKGMEHRARRRINAVIRSAVK